MAGLEARTAGLLRLGAWLIASTGNTLLPEPDQPDLLTLLRQHRMALSGVLGGPLGLVVALELLPPNSDRHDQSSSSPGLP